MKCKKCNDWICVYDEEQARSNYKETGLCFVCSKEKGLYCDEHTDIRRD